MEKDRTWPVYSWRLQPITSPLPSLLTLSKRSLHHIVNKLQFISGVCRTVISDHINSCFIQKLTFGRPGEGLKGRLLVVSRSQAWIEEQQMGAFLSVSKGSEEPPVFLELHYNGCPDHTQAPLLLVGKGITFDR